MRDAVRSKRCALAIVDRRFSELASAPLACQMNVHTRKLLQHDRYSCVHTSMRGALWILQGVESETPYLDSLAAKRAKCPSRAQGQQGWGHR